MLDSPSQWMKTFPPARKDGAHAGKDGWFCILSLEGNYAFLFSLCIGTPLRPLCQRDLAALRACLCPCPHLWTGSNQGEFIGMETRGFVKLADAVGSQGAKAS